MQWTYIAATRAVGYGTTQAPTAQGSAHFVARKQARSPTPPGSKPSQAVRIQLP